jgi:hypothetical protein
MRLVVLSIVALALLLFSVMPANACLPRGPGPWFNASIDIDTANLPPDVAVLNNDSEFPQIANHSSIPIYLVADNPSKQKYPGSEVPDSYRPINKVVSDKVYVYSSKSASLAQNWQVGDPYVRAADIATLSVTNYKLDGNNNQIYGYNRPAFVKIPDAQNLTVLTYYQGRLLPLRGRMVYTLNEAYGRGPCDSEYTPSFLGQAVVVVISIGFLTWAIASVAGIIVSSSFILLNLTHKRKRSNSNWNRLLKWSALSLALLMLTLARLVNLNNGQL